MDIISDPIIAGLLVSAFCYIYVQWNNNKNKLTRDDDEKISDMKIPIFLGVITFIGLSVWYNRKKETIRDTSIIVNDMIKIPTDIASSSAMSDSPAQSIYSPLEPQIHDVGLLKPRTFLENF
jgi:hypothetical protein